MRIEAVLVLSILSLASPARAAEPDTVAVRLERIADRKAVFATVESVDLALARARIGGTVASLAIDEGAHVKAGQQIAVVGDPKLQLEQAAMDQRIRSLEAQVAQARTEMERGRELRRSGTIPQARLDDLRTALEVAERQLGAMRSDRQVTVERMSEGAVLAPADGRVLEVKVTEGSVVLPGETIASIATQSFILRMQLPERHARFLKIGDTVLVGPRSLGDGAAEPGRRGTVRQVYPRIERGRVIADVSVDGLGDYFVGERVAVTVSTGERETIVLPADFVQRRFGVDMVRLKDGGEVVVQPGQVFDGRVEILSGLMPGDVVVRP
ncbi:MAG: efflux RND transporter periplasmic adaptor subunit [Alphaproteobacteria bacterium]|nr:efflux RND transporter periplasmic adaptor subunit [Alphaproteobacteria bacterium]